MNDYEHRCFWEGDFTGPPPTRQLLPWHELPSGGVYRLTSHQIIDSDNEMVFFYNNKIYKGTGKQFNKLKNA